MYIRLNKCMTVVKVQLHTKFVKRFWPWSKVCGLESFQRVENIILNLCPHSLEANDLLSWDRHGSSIMNNCFFVFTDHICRYLDVDLLREYVQNDCCSMVVFN